MVSLPPISLVNAARGMSRNSNRGFPGWARIEDQTFPIRFIRGIRGQKKKRISNQSSHRTPLRGIGALHVRKKVLNALCVSAPLRELKMKRDSKTSIGEGHTRRRPSLKGAPQLWGYPGWSSVSGGTRPAEDFVFLAQRRGAAEGCPWA